MIKVSHYSDEDLKFMLNEDLAKHVRACGAANAYYEVAENPQRGVEKEAREDAKREYVRAMREAAKRGLDVNWKMVL